MDKYSMKIKGYSIWFMASLLVVFMGGCGSSSSGGGGSSAGAVCTGSSCVSLGTAANYAILAQTGITNVPTSKVTGNMGISPNTSAAIAGFALNLPAGSSFSTSAQVTGDIYAPDYAPPTPANLTTAISDMQTAYTTAAGRTVPAPVLNLNGGSMGGQTLAPGIYKWTTNVTIPTDVTLSGNASDVWIFQIAGNLTQASATKVILSGGAHPENIFWQVASGVTVGTTAQMKGIVMSQTAITMGNSSSVNGRLFAQSAVNIVTTTVTQP